MAYFSLGVVCNSLDEVNDLIYPFHNEFIGYYPKEYYERNKDEKKHLKFNNFSEEVEQEWETLTLIEKEKFNFDIERFADVKYGYYYNEDNSDIGYYTNKNGKMMCFTIGGRFSGMLKVKGSIRKKKAVDYAKIEDIIIPERREKFATYAIINNGKWMSVEESEDRDEWFYIHYKRMLKKIDQEKLLVIVECCYSK
ncbi:hypothetical protein [uncultured Clostridium sp.]|jgi:hypothetical protein|uniref:hypothetical protein n=1 Tax=uncultured Clostridium sp. TaxID=59620 RepID=UPI002638D1D9|nr:hypothetical protein [uncultured Clostridium sp.]